MSVCIFLEIGFHFYNCLPKGIKYHICKKAKSDKSAIFHKVTNSYFFWRWRLSRPLVAPILIAVSNNSGSLSFTR